MKKLLIGLLIAPIAMGAISDDKKYKLNQAMGGVASEVQLGTLLDEGGQRTLVKDGHQAKQLVVGTYDYAVHGGNSVGDRHLGVTIPDNAIITRSYIDVVTTIVGQGAALVLTTETTGDVKGSTAITSFSGQVEGVSTGTAATMKKMTADRGLLLDINNTALTAGKFKVYIEYVMSE